MSDTSFLHTLLSLVLLFSDAVPADPDPLQDLCVADLNNTLKVDGFACKPSTMISEMDFTFSGLATPGDTNNSAGSKVNAANVEKIPGLNTLGIAMSRVDYAPGGINPPHTHPRATEILFVLDGTLLAGFITTANRLFSKTLSKGDVFVFPKALIHFQKNVGTNPAAALTALNSQLPGTQSVVLSPFAASPPLPDDVLKNTFQIGPKEVEKIKDRLQPNH